MDIEAVMLECNQTAREKGWWEKTCDVCNGTGTEGDYACPQCLGIKKLYNDRNIGEVIMLMVTELAEAYEEIREGIPLDHIYLKKGSVVVSNSPWDVDLDPTLKPEGVPVELADVLIRIFDFCQEKNIPLEHALRIKMDYNKTRPYRHGGKKA